jgi:hypothetical protein
MLERTLNIKIDSCLAFVPHALSKTGQLHRWQLRLAGLPIWKSKIRGALTVYCAYNPVNPKLLTFFCAADLA